MVFLVNIFEKLFLENSDKVFLVLENESIFLLDYFCLVFSFDLDVYFLYEIVNWSLVCFMSKS